MADLDNIHLAFGAHYSREEGMCLMEAVAYIAGEPHTDRPECVCPVLASFGRVWNDALNDEDRNRLLRPFIRRLIGTRSTPKVEERRAFMAADWAVRVAAPVWLRAAGLDDEAASLEALAPLDSAAACSDAMPTIEQVREAAGAAAGVAAPAAARAAITDAAKVSARAAGGAAAVAAAWAADAAGGADAVRTAAGAAAWDADVYAATAAGLAAASDVAREALRPHVEQLQASAVDLYEQMIEVTA
jgi:hypothetical protein